MDHDIYAIADFVLDKATLRNGIDFHNIRSSIQDYFVGHRQNGERRGIDVVEDELLRAVARRLVVAPDCRVESEGDELQTSTAQVLCDSADLSKSFEDLRLVPSEDRLWRTLCGHGINYRLLTREEFNLLVETAKAGTGGVLQQHLSDLTGEHIRAVSVRTNNLMRNGYLVKVNCRYPASSVNKTYRIWHSRFKDEAAAFDEQEQGRESARKHAIRSAAATRAQAHRQASTASMSECGEGTAEDPAEDLPQAGPDFAPSVVPQTRLNSRDERSTPQSSGALHRLAEASEAESYMRPLAPRPIAPWPPQASTGQFAREASFTAPSRPARHSMYSSDRDSYHGYNMLPNGYTAPATPAFAHTPGIDHSSPYLGSPFTTVSTSYQPGLHVYRGSMGPEARPGENAVSMHDQCNGHHAHSATGSPHGRAQISTSPISREAMTRPAQAANVSYTLQSQAQGSPPRTILAPTGHQSSPRRVSNHWEEIPSSPLLDVSSVGPQHSGAERPTPGNRKRKMSYRAQAAALVKKRKLDLEAMQSPDQPQTEDDLYVKRSLVLPTPSCRVYRPKKYVEQAEEVIRGRPQKKLILVIKSARLRQYEAFRNPEVGQTNIQRRDLTEPHAHNSRAQVDPQDSNNFFAYQSVQAKSQQDESHLNTARARPDDAITAVPENQLDKAKELKEIQAPYDRTDPAAGSQPDPVARPIVPPSPPDIRPPESQPQPAHTSVDHAHAAHIPTHRSTAMTSLQSPRDIQSLQTSTGRPIDHRRSYTSSESAYTFPATPEAQVAIIDSTPTSRPTSYATATGTAGLAHSGTRRASEVARDLTSSKHVTHTSNIREGRNHGSRLVLEIIEKASGVYPGDGQIWFPYVTGIRKYSSTTPYRTTVDNIVNDLVKSGDIKNQPFTFEKNGSVVTKHVLLISTLAEASKQAWECKEAMIQAHPSKFFPEGPEVDPALVANPHPNRRLLQKKVVAPPRSAAPTKPKQSNIDPQQAPQPQMEEPIPQPGSSHLGKRKRTSSVAQRKDRDVSIDPEDLPNEEQTSLQASFQILRYVHEPKAAPQGPIARSKGGPSSPSISTPVTQNAGTPEIAATPRQSDNARPTQPGTSASKQRSNAMRKAPPNSRVRQSSTRPAQFKTGVPGAGHATAIVAAKPTPKAINLTWEEDELTKAAFEQEALREQQERDQPFQSEVTNDAALPDPTAWIIDSQSLAADQSHAGPGQKICVTLTDPLQRYHGPTGTFSTDFAVWRDIRPKLKLQPDAQRRFEDTLPKDLKEMTRARRMRWLGRATDFERAVDAVAAWEEDNESRLTSAQSLMIPRFINHFVTNDDIPRPPKAPRLIGDAPAIQAAKRAEKAGMSTTSKISGRKSMPSSRLMEARDAEPLLQPLLQPDSLPSSDPSSPAVIQPKAPTTKVTATKAPLPPPQPARPSSNLPARPESKVPLLPNGTEAFAKYKHAEGTVSKDDIVSEAITIRIIVAIVIVRTLVPNNQGNVHWPAVCRLLPDIGHYPAHNRWTYLKVSQESLIKQCQQIFEKEYLAACGKGELPLIDYEDVESYCWERLLDWALNKAKEAGLGPVGSEDMLLPATREALEDEYLIEPERPQELNGTSDRLGVGNAAMGGEKPSPETEDLGNMTVQEQTPGTAGNTLVTEQAIALTMVRANIFAPFESYNGKAARARLSVFPDKVLAEAIATLKNRGIIQTVNKIAGKLQANATDGSSNNSTPTPAPTNNLQMPGDPRIYIPDPAFINMLDNAHGESWSPYMLYEAAAYKLSLDSVFGDDLRVYADAPSSPSAGQMMVLTSLRENNEITATPIVTPKQHYDGKLPMPSLRFQPTERYQLGLSSSTTLPNSERYGLNPPAPHLNSQNNGQKLIYSGAQSKKERRIPLWYTINDLLMPEVFEKVVALVLYVVVIGDGVTVADVVRGMRGKVEAWDVEVVLGWLMESQAIVQQKRAGQERVVYRAGRMWWGVLGVGDGKAS